MSLFDNEIIEDYDPDPAWEEGDGDWEDLSSPFSKYDEEEGGHEF